MKILHRFVVMLLVFLNGFVITESGAAEELSDSAKCMALVIYWEAKTESEQGMYAVGQVVLNRVKHKEFPSSICSVMREGGEQPPCQFHFWCDGKSDSPGR